MELRPSRRYKKAMHATKFEASLSAGSSHFMASRFFEAHEAWEAGWLQTHGTEKHVLQVLVLWAAAYHHARKHNRTGALNLMQRALEKLERSTGEARAPLDLEALREALVHSWEALSAPGPLNLTPPAWRSTGELDEGLAEVDLLRRTSCPYCGEPVAVEVDAELAGGAEYVEDCPVCCHPWTVVIRDDAGRVFVGLERGDE
jgi:predicted metal-dependent hydrolase